MECFRVGRLPGVNGKQASIYLGLEKLLAYAHQQNRLQARMKKGGYAVSRKMKSSYFTPHAGFGISMEYKIVSSRIKWLCNLDEQKILLTLQ